MASANPWTFSTLPDFCHKAAQAYGDRPAIEDGGLRISYAQFNTARMEIAAALIASGLNTGESVMIMMPNCAEWLVIAMGIVSAGGVVIPVSTRFRGPEIEDLALRGKARFLFSTGDFLGCYYPDLLTTQTREQLKEVIVLGRNQSDTSLASFKTRANAICDTLRSDREAEIGPESLCDTLFTSGTTGRSKGVKYAHKQLLDVAFDWSKRVGLQQDDRILVLPPFFHAFGYHAAALGGLICGATILPHQTFDPEIVLRRVARDRVSVIPGPPAIFQGMLNLEGWEKTDRSSLRLGITGGAVIPEVLVRRMKDGLGFDGVCNGYGLTECGGFGAMCKSSDSIDVIANTAGTPMDHTEVEMMDPEGHILPRGETGEIVIRGPIVMQGYLDDPKATAEAIDPNGWLHTGDIGRFDNRGNLLIEDRLKDMYITGGFNCYPAEIERVLSDHPSVGQVAVIGVPDTRLGEVGKAFVILRPGTDADEAGLIAWSRDMMANYKVPRSVEICTSLPVSPQGKVLKRMLS